MASAQVDMALRSAREVFGPASGEGGHDRQLLERFIARREEAAFEALVIRHGPRVLWVCRQVLGDSEDADDAFQATFLVLVRKAETIRARDSLGPWLHGVARRVALRAKLRSKRRREQERRVVEMPAVEPSDEIDQRDLRPVLDEELSRLPDKYRLPVLFCYLQGMTNEEAARRLQCPPGTLKGRLARAREILRERLGRRGVVLGGGLMIWLSSDSSAIASIAVPDRLIAVTVKSSVLAAQGKLAAGSSMSANVAALVDDALRSMLVGKVLRTTTTLLAFAAIGAAVFIISTTLSFRTLVAGTMFDPAILFEAKGGCH
jgi:RNA polymerase sigma factor (sigma-70 family)